MKAYSHFIEKPLQISHSVCGNSLKVVVYAEMRENFVEKHVLHVSSRSLSNAEILEQLRGYFEKRIKTCSIT